MDRHNKSEKIFKVEKIIRKRRKKGNTEYLVKWQGYNGRHNSWEPADNFLDKSVIDAFEGNTNPQSNESESQSPSKSKPTSYSGRKRTRRVSSTNDVEPTPEESDGGSEIPATSNDQITPKDQIPLSSDNAQDSDIPKESTVFNDEKDHIKVEEEEMVAKTPPRLQPEVSESEAWVIQERNKILFKERDLEGKGRNDGLEFRLVVTDVFAHDFSVIFKESQTPEGFFRT